MEEGMLKTKDFSLNVHTISHFWWHIHSAEQRHHLPKGLTMCHTSGCACQTLHTGLCSGLIQVQGNIRIWYGKATLPSVLLKLCDAFGLVIKEQNLILTHRPWTITYQGVEISNSLVCWLNTSWVICGCSKESLLCLYWVVCTFILSQ